MQQSVSTTASSSHPVSAVCSSAPIISTAGILRDGYSTATTLSASRYSWMPQTLSGLPTAYDRTAVFGVNEAASQLSAPATVGSTSEVQCSVSHAGLPTSETQEQSRLSVAEKVDDDLDDCNADNRDDSSLLSLSVNRFI